MGGVSRQRHGAVDSLYIEAKSEAGLKNSATRAANCSPPDKFFPEPLQNPMVFGFTHLIGVT